MGRRVIPEISLFFLNTEKKKGISFFFWNNVSWVKLNRIFANSDNFGNKAEKANCYIASVSANEDPLVVSHRSSEFISD